jgi:hypothetical protein
MNFILGRLIKFLSEEEAFWVFTMLIESILPLDYFTQMIGILAETHLLKDHIRESLPKIHTKLQELNFDSMFFSVNWFVCLFSDKLAENVISLNLTIYFVDNACYFGYDFHKR